VNYRHAFHAGNFADVVKHVVLTGVLLHLKKKEKPFRVIDTHAGRGLYDLAGGEAERTGEAKDGIARLRDLSSSSDLPAALATYLEIARSWGDDRYPGSPLIAARLLRNADRLIAIERHPEDAEALRRSLASFANAEARCADGYARLASLLPPPERRGLALIDPPYEVEQEFAHVASALAAARKRFATGIYLLWYPIKSRAASEALSGEVLAQGTQDVLRVTIDVGRAQTDEKERLSAAGILLVNPPFGLADELRSAAEILGPRLGHKVDARIAVEDL
jgi:23S rRNA (adenine2030-N6)-methyltransferase